LIAKHQPDVILMFGLAADAAFADRDPSANAISTMFADARLPPSVRR
jgi:hypothetical protein